MMWKIGPNAKSANYGERPKNNLRARSTFDAMELRSTVSKRRK
jgi:hypothetical protein